MSGLDAIINRPRLSWLSLFWRAPLKTLAKTIHSWRKLRSSRVYRPLRVVCTSDTHNSQPIIPPGDVLIHAGDLTQSGTFDELQQTLDWLNRQSHSHIIAIAGNHDRLLDPDYASHAEAVAQRAELRWGKVVYLQDSSTSIESANGRSLKIWGTPWTRKHGNWAFQFSPGSKSHAAAHFDQIPEDAEILVSHMPPRFHLDLDGFGDESLLENIKRVRPALHVFGHVHEGYGKSILAYDAFEERYQRVCRGEAGAWQIVRMAWDVFFGGSARTAKTILVNPAAVGGLRDDARRTPISVDLEQS